MEPFCEALDEWLSADGENISAVHCKAGKGRTGLVICIYLIHTGMWERSEDALRLNSILICNCLLCCFFFFFFVFL